MRTSRFSIVALGLALTCAGSRGLPANAPRAATAPAPAVSDAAATPAAVLAARELGGVDPRRALESLRDLRRAAMTQGDRQLRWAADVAECRLVQDIDVHAAAAVARAGLREPPPAAGAPPALLSVWLQLRACAAGVMLQQGESTAGGAELDAVLAASRIPGMEGAHAMALMERGDARSRVGDLVRAQADLLQACDALTRLQWTAEARYCIEHVASHYARVGEYNLALKYYRELLADARSRSARHDEGIVLYNIARLYVHRNDPAVAIDWFRQARAIERSKRDPLGIAYNDAGIGAALLSLGQPATALPYLRSAEPVFTRLGDSQAQETRVGIAAALADTGQATEALTLLNRTEPDVRTRGDDLLLAQLLGARAAAQAGMDQWRNAYQSLRAQRIVIDRVNERRQSEQAARLRLQFDSEKDAAQLQALERLNARERTLQHTQEIALALALALLGATGLYAWQKWKLARHLRALAMLDDLTRIANRRAILALGEDLLHQTRLSGSELSVLLIDIDHFKDINDRLGHAVGDRVLRHVALLVGNALRPRDGLGRLGGEEFLALLPATGAESAVVLAERVRALLAAATVAAHAQPVRLTISVGVATARRGEPLARLLDRADQALYRAKSDGRNRVCAAGDSGSSGWWSALTLEKPAPRAPAAETSSHAHDARPPDARRA